MKSTGIPDRRLFVLCASLFLAASAACSSSDGTTTGAAGTTNGAGTSGAAGTTGGAGTNGAAGTTGAGGRGGAGGAGGMSGTSGAGSTCASGVPSGAGGGCTQGTSSVGTVVHAQGFTAYDGRAVKAAFTRGGGGEIRTAETLVQNGVFNLDFLFATTTCNLGGNSTAGGALYIDIDGNSTCNPAADFVFVWGATGGPPGTCFPVTLTPQSEQCASLDFPGTADAALTAAQSVCPAVGNCLDFCGPRTGTGGSSQVFCPTGGTGGRGGQGGSGGRGGQGGG
jgi:hypothetical protein